MIRVMVVDDHELVRSGISRLITDEADMEVVALAASGEETLQLLRTVTPHVVLMDVTMPGMSGMEATQRITRQYPDIRLIALSPIETGMIPQRMLRAGAVAFLSKNVSAMELMRAIRAVYLGQRYITSQLATQIALESTDGSQSPFDCLSEREMQVALMLIDCNTINVISENLSLSPKTVYSYRYRIFEKLGVRSDAALIILAVKHGLGTTSAEMMLAT